MTTKKPKKQLLMSTNECQISNQMKTKPETQTETKKIRKRAFSMWVKCRFKPTHCGNGEFWAWTMENPDGMGHGALWVKDEDLLRKLRAAQPKITCEDCCEVRDYDKDIAKARAEGMAQGRELERKELLDDFEKEFKASYGDAELSAKFMREAAIGWIRRKREAQKQGGTKP